MLFVMKGIAASTGLLSGSDGGGNVSQRHPTSAGVAPTRPEVNTANLTVGIRGYDSI
jgi:hypothetical protein